MKKFIIATVLLLSFVSGNVYAYNYTSTSSFHVRYYRDYSNKVTSTSGLRDGYAEASAQAHNASYASWARAPRKGAQVYVVSYSNNASGSRHWHGGK